MNNPREFSCFDSEQDGWGNDKQWWEEWAEMKANQQLDEDLDEIGYEKDEDCTPDEKLQPEAQKHAINQLSPTNPAIPTQNDKSGFNGQKNG